MKVEDILPFEKLSSLYLDQKMSDQKIADDYGLTNGQVHRLRNKYRIRTLEQYERHHKAKLDHEELSLIVGATLGDAHIRLRKGKNTYPSIMFEQSVKHKEYIYWLKDCMSDWLYNTNKPIVQNRKKNKNGKTYHSYSFQTISHPAFFEAYHAFYKNGKKQLNLKWIEKHINAFSLAVWIMDDGTLTGKSKRNMIATNSFTFQEVNGLRKILDRKFGLKTWNCKRTNTQEVTYEIAFDKKSSRVLNEMLGDLVIPEMKYKLLHSETAKDATVK